MWTFAVEILFIILKSVNFRYKDPAFITPVMHLILPVKFREVDSIGCHTCSNLMTTPPNLK